MLPACLLTLALVAAPPPRFDSEGFPLPPEVVRRLGSRRFLVNQLKAAAFSPDGRTVYTVTQPDPTARSRWVGPGLTAWDAATGWPKWRALADAPIQQLAADPDGKTVWVLTETGPLDVTEVVRLGLSSADGHEVYRAVLRPRRVFNRALHPSGAVAWVSEDRQDSYSLRVTTPDGRNTVERFIGPTRVGQLVWNAAGDRLFFPVSTPDGKQRELWAMDTKSGDIVWAVEAGGTRAMAMAPADKLLVRVCPEPIDRRPNRFGTGVRVRGHDPASGKEVGSVSLPHIPLYTDYTSYWQDHFRTVMFHPNGKLVSLRYHPREGGPVAIDLTTWKPLESPPVLLDAVFSPDGKTALVTRGRNGVLCDAATGKSIDPPGRSFTVGPGNWPTLRFSPSGECLVRTAGLEVTVWDVATGAARRRSVWDGLVYRLPRDRTTWERAHWDDEPKEFADTRATNGRTAYWPGGKLRAYWSVEGIHVQDAKTGEVLHTFGGQTRPVWAMAFSPDGRLLAAESEDGPILLWSVPPVGK